MEINRGMAGQGRARPGLARLGKDKGGEKSPPFEKKNLKTIYEKESNCY